MEYTHSFVLNEIFKNRLVAILRRVPEEKLGFTVEALIKGGVKVLEFTFDHDSPACTEENARKIETAKARFGSEIIIGCGTVLSVAEVEAAHSAGASLVISPNVHTGVIARTRELEMVSMPGALTPTEIVSAWDAGADIVKLFPAGELGVSYIKAVRGPLAHIPMSAVGGVKPENVADFLSAGVCGFGVGGPLVIPAAVKSGDWAAITARALEFRSAIDRWEAENG